MNYIVVDSDKQNSTYLKKILDEYKTFDFKGSFMTVEEAEISLYKGSPDMAFIRMGKAGINAFKLVSVLRGVNPSVKIFLHSSEGGYAIEAFEYEADGFLMIPFEKEKIKHMLRDVLKTFSTTIGNC